MIYKASTSIKNQGACLSTIIMVRKGTSSSYRLVDSIGLWSYLV